MIVAPNAMFINQRETIIGHALAAGLPTIFGTRGDVEAGGFMSYGVNHIESLHHAAAFVDKILKGAKPGDLPIEFANDSGIFRSVFERVVGAWWPGR